MQVLLRRRPLKLLFLGNFVSMLGTGMNSAALGWYVLQATHSEIPLGILMLLQTVPAILLAPVSGVIVDRNDRRRLGMVLDALRAAIILCVAALCLLHRAQLWQLFTMNLLIAALGGIAWPAMTALTQELTPEDEFVSANTLLMVGVQGGLMVAGLLVGVTYNRIGLGGVLVVDVATYFVSIACYSLIRTGHHLPAGSLDKAPSRGVLADFFRDTSDCVSYLRGNLYVVLLGASSAILLAAMMAQSVVIPPLADRILHAGPVGFGWINAAFGLGAFLSAGLVPLLVRKMGVRGSIVLAMAALTAGCLVATFSSVLGLTIGLFLLMGAARGVGLVASNSGLMRVVPQNYMGRVQNTFTLAARILQMILGVGLGVVAHNLGLFAAFCVLAMAYLAGAVAAGLAGKEPVVLPAPVLEQTVEAE